MTGEQFLDALKAAIAPATITNMIGKSDKIVIALSDGRSIEAKRLKIKAAAAAADPAELSAYVQSLI